MSDDETLAYVAEVLAIFAEADAREELFWKPDDDGRILFFAMCNDWFWWATADCEPIEPQDVPLLRQTLTDLQALPGADDGAWDGIYLSSLYASRKRQMRPMIQVFTDENKVPEAVAELLRACGPERPLGAEDEPWRPKPDAAEAAGL